MPPEHSFHPRVPGYRLLHSPGPSRIPDEVVHAMSRQPMDMADPRFISVVNACEVGLKGLLGTRSDVYLYACNGHGAWEAVIARFFEAVCPARSWTDSAVVPVIPARQVPLVQDSAALRIST